MGNWVVAAKKADFAQLAEEFKIDPVTVRLIRNRDIIGEAAMRQYLYGSLADLHDPHLLKDCEQAVAILIAKINSKSKIRIMGDYDIDGVNASCILYKGLRRCGADVDVEIPDRIKDGYGINGQMIEAAYQEGIDTILTCDNGIAAITQVQQAKELGMTVIITDHHEIQEQLPPADAVINPKQADCQYPYKSLCGGVVAYKLIVALYQALGINLEETEELLEFAAIATVGDVMDLTGENRIIVKEGLKRINQTRNRGLKALIAANGLEGKPIVAYHIGFVLGPCMNASGRLATAKRALALLLAEDENTAAELAQELKDLNEERKTMTKAGLEEAIQLIESSSLKADKVLVVYLPDCHESLAGIIAGRLRERYHKPAFVLTDGEDGVKGSGRSIEAYQMFDELCKCSELLTKFGGHPMAAGLSLPPEHVVPFRQHLNQETALTEADFIPKVVIDVPMPIDYITEERIMELSVLEPFGKGNPKPVFAEKGLNILGARILGKNKNVIKMQTANQSGMSIEAMYFGDVEKFIGYVSDRFGESEKEKLFQNRDNKVFLSVTYYPTVNEYMDRRTLQIVVQDYQ